jgi:hypothetical protein
MDIYGDEQRVIVCWEAHIIYVIYVLEHIHTHKHDNTICSALARPHSTNTTSFRQE